MPNSFDGGLKSDIPNSNLWLSYYYKYSTGMLYMLSFYMFVGLSVCMSVCFDDTSQERLDIKSWNVSQI